MTHTHFRNGIVVAVCTLALGCGKIRQAAVNAKNNNDLKMIGLAFHNFADANTGKAPAKAEDLDPYLKDAPEVSQGLKSGKYVFLWGASLADIMKAGTTSNTVLAYEKDVPAQGGLVLYADGSVTKMSADEFKAAKKAK